MGKIKFYIKRAFRTFNQMEMRILPGNIAFFFVLAMVPMVTLVAIIASYFHISIDTIILFIKVLFLERQVKVLLKLFLVRDLMVM